MKALARALLLAFGSLAVVALSCGFDETPCLVAAETIFVGCPTTFDGTEADLPRCGTSGVIAARTCGKLNELMADTTSLRRACVYDATTHRLVGARLLPGEPTACGPKAPNQVWGRQVDLDCRDGSPAIMRDCGAGRDGGDPG